MSSEKEIYDLKQTIRRQKTELDAYKNLVTKVQELLNELLKEDSNG